MRALNRIDLFLNDNNLTRVYFQETDESIRLSKVEPGQPTCINDHWMENQKHITHVIQYKLNFITTVKYQFISANILSPVITLYKVETDIRISVYTYVKLTSLVQKSPIPSIYSFVYTFSLSLVKVKPSFSHNFLRILI